MGSPGVRGAFWGHFWLHFGPFWGRFGPFLCQFFPGVFGWISPILGWIFAIFGSIFPLFEAISVPILGSQVGFGFPRCGSAHLGPLLGPFWGRFVPFVRRFFRAVFGWIFAFLGSFLVLISGFFWVFRGPAVGAAEPRPAPTGGLGPGPGVCPGGRRLPRPGRAWETRECLQCHPGAAARFGGKNGDFGGEKWGFWQEKRGFGGFGGRKIGIWGFWGENGDLGVWGVEFGWRCHQVTLR